MASPVRRFRYDETTSLGSRLIELSPSLSQRVLVIVLSDMHDLRALPALKRLAQEHDCAVLQFAIPPRTVWAASDLSEPPRQRPAEAYWCVAAFSIPPRLMSKNSSKRPELTIF